MIARIPTLLLAALLTLACTESTPAQAVLDPSFEDYSVDPGGFTKSAAGAWTFENDAGVVEPISPNSSNGPLDTWSATFAALEGTQYASTYAGSDQISQQLSFPAAGEYELSIWAASPRGTVELPNVGELTLTTGDFQFVLDGSTVGDIHTPPLDAGWARYDATFSVAAAGEHDIGVLNLKSAPYFINYDVLRVSLIPEPSVIGMLVVGWLALTVVGRRRRA